MMTKPYKLLCCSKVAETHEQLPLQLNWHGVSWWYTNTQFITEGCAQLLAWDKNWCSSSAGAVSPIQRLPAIIPSRGGIQLLQLILWLEKLGNVLMLKSVIYYINRTQAAHLQNVATGRWLERSEILRLKMMLAWCQVSLNTLMPHADLYLDYIIYLYIKNSMYLLCLLNQSGLRFRNIYKKVAERFSTKGTLSWFKIKPLSINVCVLVSMCVCVCVWRVIRRVVRIPPLPSPISVTCRVLGKDTLPSPPPVMAPLVKKITQYWKN